MAVEQALATRLFRINAEKARGVFHGGLIAGVLGLVRQTAEFDTLRASSGDLLLGIHPQDRDGNAIFIGAIGGVSGHGEKDTFKALRTLTTDKDHGIRGGTVFIAHYFEGRDDRTRLSPPGSPQIDLDVDVLDTASHHHLAGVAIWEPHSPALLKRLEQMGQSPEVFGLTAARLIADRFKEMGVVDGNAIVFSPDLGALERTAVMGKYLGKDVVFAHKTRTAPGEAAVDAFYILKSDGTVVDMPAGYLAGKTLLGMDDMIDTGGTLVSSVEKLKAEYGASRIYFGATHAIFSGQKAQDNLGGALHSGLLDGLVITDSLPSWQNVQHENIQVVSLTQPIASLVNVFSGHATETDLTLVQLCHYDPQMTKEDLNEAFEQRYIPQLAAQGRRHSPHAIFARHAN